jgi:hypothetical protein
MVGVACVPIFDHSVDLLVNILHYVFSASQTLLLEFKGLCYYFPYFQVEESGGVCGV